MSKYSLPKKDPAVSEENAHSQIMQLVDRYNIDVDNMGKEKREATEQALDYLLTEIVKGHVSIEEKEVGKSGRELCVTIYIQNRSPESNIEELTFREMRGRDHVKMSEKGNDNQYKKMHNLLSSMCITPNGQHAIGQLRSADASTAEWLSTLFL